MIVVVRTSVICPSCLIDRCICKSCIIDRSMESRFIRRRCIITIDEVANPVE